MTTAPTPAGTAAPSIAARGGPAVRAHMDATAVSVILGLCLIWGGAQTAVHIANEGMSPVFQAGLRSVASSLLLVVWCLAARRPFLRLDATLPWGLLAGVLFTGEFVCQYVGLAMTEVSRGVLFIYVSPFVAALGAHFLVPGERLTPGKLLGLLCAFAGVAIAFSKGLVLPEPRQLTGDLLCLLMGVLWGIDMLTLKITPLRRIEPERALFYALAFSAPMLLGVSWLLGEPGLTASTPRVWLAFAYTAVMVSFLSYVAMTWLLQRYPAAGIGSFMFLSPILGVAVAALVLGEKPPPSLLAALALNALGIWLVNRPSRRPPPMGDAAGP